MLLASRVLAKELMSLLDYARAVGSGCRCGSRVGSEAGLEQRAFSEGHANLGIVLSDLGDYDGAIANFEASMRLNPRLAEAPKCLGWSRALSLSLSVCACVTLSLSLSVCLCFCVCL